MRKRRNREAGIGQRDAAELRTDLSFRSQLEIRASSIDEENRSIEALISTESAIPMWDWERGEMVPEVLLTSGMELPKARQVPLLDSHSRWSVKDQLGSAREIQKADAGVVGRMFFSRAAEAEWTKVKEGHARDVSAGYQVLARIYVPANSTQTIGGKRFTGPVNVATKWRLREVSLTPIGADEQAKLRGLDPHAITRRTEGYFTMNPELRKLLETRGMPKDLDDNAAQAWLVANGARILAPEPTPAAPPATKPEPQRAAAAPAIDADAIAKLIAEGTRKALEEAEQKRTAFQAEVRSLCELAELPSEFEHCRNLADVAAVRAYLVERKAKIASGEVVNPNPRVRITGDGAERFMADVGTSLSLRAMAAATDKPESIDKVFPVAERAKGYEQWRHATIYQIAEECCRMNNIDIRGRTRDDVAICALFGPEKAWGGRSDAAYHTTANFLKLTQDAFNKSMMVGSMEARPTWRGPMRQGTSVADFKTVHRVTMGAIPNLPVWNDNTNPEKASFADAEETYAVECRSLEVDFSYKMIVNDDMNAISRVPGMLGAAAERTVNAFAWSLITSNPTMRDSVALFSAATGNRKRQNLTTGAGAPSVTTVGALTKLMRLMRGENTPEQNESDDVLNLQPVYIVGPAALEVTINQLVNSAYDPASGVNHQVFNPTRVLTPVIEPLLDADSATAWYLFCSPAQCDTVEISFLQGQERPRTRYDLDHKKLCQSWIVLQTFGGKPLNHRGIQKHAGA